MALQAIVYRDGYSYSDDIINLDATTIAISKAHFELLQQQGVIVSGNYDDQFWIISNEVIKGATISFLLDEVHFVRETAHRLGCSLSDYQAAMRVVITSRFGFAIATLQTNAATMRHFANSLEVPNDYFQAQLLDDLLALLPGDTPFRQEVQSKIDDISPLQNVTHKQRNLAHYQSYLRFSTLLDTFWETAPEIDKIFYFPIWYWYKITGVLPLRPTECVLTPRNCIRQSGERYYLTVRRTRLKKSYQGSRYSIGSDYQRKEYPIPTKLAIPILEYIAATQDVYESDIDVLFCKFSQFAHCAPYHDNDGHYTYANLHQCLSHFYRDVVGKKYDYAVVANQNLGENEILKIRLGDTRHIAMLSLIVSGGNPTICKELAGHDSIAISSHYYDNLSQFLDVLGYERYREIKATMIRSYGLHINPQYPVAQGYCQCEQVWKGDFSPCASAVNADGMPGACEQCKWFFPAKTKVAIQLPPGVQAFHDADKSGKENISLEMQQTFALLRQAIDQLRQGLDRTESVSAMLDRLAAQAQHYIRESAIARLVAEREECEL